MQKLFFHYIIQEKNFYKACFENEKDSIFFIDQNYQTEKKKLLDK